MNALLSRLDPGDAALLVAATSALIIAVAAIGSEALARLFRRRLGASAGHDVYLGALLVVLLSPAIVLGVARSGLVLMRWPRMVEQKAEVAWEPPSPPIRLAERVKSARKNVESIGRNEPVQPTVVAEKPVPEPVAAPAAIPPMTVEPSTPPFSGGRAWAGALVLTWGIGFVWGFVRLTRGMVALAWLRRRLRPFDLDGLDAVESEVGRALSIRSLPPIFEAIDLPGPVAWGVLWPVVVMPEGMAARLGAAGLRDVLIHECAHVLRRDPLVGLLQRLAALVFWPHPLVHRLNRRLSRAREEACDDLVVGEGDPCGYARTLLSLAEAGGSDWRAGPVVGLFETRWKLEERVERILNRGKEPTMRTIRGMKLASVALLALAGVAVAAIRPAEDAPKAGASKRLEQEAGIGSVITGQVVDEAGKPVPGASVNVVRMLRAPEDAKTDAQGRFTLKIPGPVLSQWQVEASIDGRARLGVVDYEEPNHSRPEPVRIVLKPARNVVARVVDAAGKPVEGAKVGADSLMSGLFDETTTDAAGVAHLRVPADAKVDNVIALKDGAGFDYFGNYRSWPSRRRDPLPSEVTLVLDGARSARVRVIDTEGNPIAGVEVGPWTLGKRGKLGDFNASGCTMTCGKTGEDGIARLDWLPKTLQRVSLITFSPLLHESYEQYLLPRGQEVTTIRLSKLVKLSGKVTNPDGSPVRGVLVKAMSEGKSNNYGSYQARTGDDGGYSVWLPPDQIAIVAVIDPERAARALTGIVVRENEPQELPDFKLVEGARFVARIIDGSGKAVPGAQLTWHYLGIELPEKFVGTNGNERQELIHWVKANNEGTVEVRLGPGDYQVLGQDKFHVAGPGEIVREYRQPAETYDPNPKPFHGVVVDVTAGASRPVAGAIVRFSRQPGQGEVEALTDSEGRFEVEPHFGLEGGFLVARDRDGTKAGFLVLGDKPAEPARVEIRPSATASGRVLDSEGRAVVGRNVQLLVSLPGVAPNGPSFFDPTATDDNGRYQFQGLVPGAECEVSVLQQDARSLDDAMNVGVSTEKFTVAGSDPIDLPDIKFPGQESPAAQAGEKFPASEVQGAGPMPFVISRADVEALVRAIGREQATPEVIAQVFRVVRPQEHWITDLDKIRRLATDPTFVAQADQASTAIYGKPADTATLAELADMHQIGYGEAALRHTLNQSRARRPGKPGRGIVEDAITGRPIAGAVVYNGSAITTTDASGTYTIDSSSRRNAWVEAEGYALTEATPSLDPEKPSKIGLVREQPIVGRVVEREGLKPVEGAIVWAMANHTIFRPGGKRDRTDHYGFPLTARTDAQGRFTFRGMPPGVELDWFEIHHPSFRPASNNPEALKADEAATLTVEPGCVVEGEVVDENGRGVAGVSIALRPHDQNMDRYSASTDQNGRYRLANLPADRWVMTVQPERKALKRLTVITEDGRAAINQVVVEPGWIIRGKVVDARDNPVNGAVVGWPNPVDDQGNPIEAQAIHRIAFTEPDGTFQLGGFPPGKYQLTVAGNSPGRDLKIVVPVAKSDLIIRLPDPK